MPETTTAGSWPIGTFDLKDSLRKGRKFEDLSLTPGERTALEIMQKLYDCYTSAEMKKAGRHSGMNMTEEVMLARLRGMKNTFEVMMMTDDARLESMIWQSRLY